MNAGFAGMNILDDLHSGVIERLRVTPASRLALILGIVLCDVLTALLSSLLLILAAVPMGFRADWLGIALLFGLLVLVHTMMVSASYAIALIIKESKRAGGNGVRDHCALATAVRRAAAADACARQYTGCRTRESFLLRGRCVTCAGRW